MTDLITEARELCADAQLEAALLELKTMSGWINKVVYHKLGIRWSFDNNNLIHWIVVFMRLLPELCDALEKANEQNKHLMHEVCKLACESVERDKALARLEAEVEDALREKAEREKGCEACGLIYKLDGAAYGTVDELIDNTFCPMCGKRLEEHHEAD